MRRELARLAHELELFEHELDATSATLISAQRSAQEREREWELGRKKERELHRERDQEREHTAHQLGKEQARIARELAAKSEECARLAAGDLANGQPRT